MSKFYVTSAIPYVNDKPHVGHALEYVQADVIRRYHQLRGDETLFLCGGDENAIKNVQAAERAGENVQEFINSKSILFKQLAEKLNAPFDVFQKGSAQNHHTSSQQLWKLCAQNGDIYKKSYSGLYCVGCEQFYEKEELNENGECFEHPGKKLEEVTEENYFFKLSKYEQQILEILETNTIKITPFERKNEVLSFVKQGLKDISISRSNKRARNWGVDVPNDPTQKMYVWFDALNIYQSGIGFGSDEKSYTKWWPADVHVIGKGIIRFHAVYWPAFLLSAGLQLPKSLFVHGYFTIDGQKMSKTLGNVIDPVELINAYGADVLRYYFLRELPPTSDGDFSERRLKEIYASDLQNGLGNLVSRVAKLCETSSFQNTHTKTLAKADLDKEYLQLLAAYRFNEAVEYIWQQIEKLNKYINDTKPWELAKSDEEKLEEVLQKLVQALLEVAALLEPILPSTASKIKDVFSQSSIQSISPLFPKLT